MSVTIDLSGKSAIVFGVANHRSIAWAIAQKLHEAGANITLAYQNERLRDQVDKLAAELDRVNTVECDVMSPASLGVAFEQASSGENSLEIVIHIFGFPALKLLIIGSTASHVFHTQLCIFCDRPAKLGTAGGKHDRAVFILYFSRQKE